MGVKQRKPKNAERARVDLAAALGVSRQSLYNWSKIEGAPRTWDVESWQAFMTENGLGKSRDLAAVKLLIAEQELQKKTRENQIAGREVLPIAESMEAAQKATQVWQSGLKAKIETEAPSRLLGKDIAELRAELRIIHDELCAEVAKVFSESIQK